MGNRAVKIAGTAAGITIPVFCVQGRIIIHVDGHTQPCSYIARNTARNIGQLSIPTFVGQFYIHRTYRSALLPEI